MKDTDIFVDPPVGNWVQVKVRNWSEEAKTPLPDICKSESVHNPDPWYEAVVTGIDTVNEQVVAELTLELKFTWHWTLEPICMYLESVTDGGVLKFDRILKAVI